MKTQNKSQLESKITEAVIKFEREYMGRGPFRTRTYLVEDMVIVRLEGVLTPAEQHLAKELSGVKLIKEVRMNLIQGARTMLCSTVEELVGRNVISMHSDISATRGERVIVFTLQPEKEK